MEFSLSLPSLEYNVSQEDGAGEGRGKVTVGNNCFGEVPHSPDSDCSVIGFWLRLIDHIFVY